MTTVFHGDVLLPGETGSGLAASLELDDDQMTLASGSEVLASWRSHEATFEASGDGSFRLSLEGEDVFFRPDSPMAFAKAVDRARPTGRPDTDRSRPDPVGGRDLVSFSPAPETAPSNPPPEAAPSNPAPSNGAPTAPGAAPSAVQPPVREPEPVVTPPSDDAVLDEVLAELAPSRSGSAMDAGDDLITPAMLKVIGAVATVIIVAALLAVAFL